MWYIHKTNYYLTSKKKNYWWMPWKIIEVSEGGKKKDQKWNYIWYYHIWNHVSLIGSWTQPKPRLRLEFMVFKLRSHLILGLNEAQILDVSSMNSVRDKLTGKKWNYLERNTLDRQSAHHLRRWEQPQNMLWLIFMGWIIS